MGMSQQQTTAVKDVKIFRPWDHKPSEDTAKPAKVIQDDYWPIGWSGEMSGWSPELSGWYPGGLPELTQYTTTKQRPKKFKCPHCQVGFTNNGQLKGHLRIHTGERPFKCEEEGCGKSFTRNEELTRHKRIHSGLRPYPCTTCGKTFGRKDHLKKHIKTHLPQPQPLPVPAYLFYPYVFC